MNIITELDDAGHWALGFDRLQWMLLQAKFRRGEREWQPVVFVASEKRVLRRTLAAKGVTLTERATALIDAMPDHFSDFIAEREVGADGMRKAA